MNTRKALRRASIWSGIFCFFCVLSTVCFAIYYYFDVSYDFVGVGMLSVYGWMVNPMPILSCILCLTVYLKVRKDPEAKEIIGKRWIWIFVLPAITTVFWLLGSILFVTFTGGV